jgi:hypothetical protein
MSHFPEEDWTDFTRDEGEPEQRERMQRHLDDGCPDCSRAQGVWDAVGRIAGQEPSFDPPESAVRQAKGWYGIQKPDRFLSRVGRAASLLFDSARHPQPAGVRSAAASSSRQFLYRVGTRLIKLRLETPADSGPLTLVGQVVDETEPERELPDVPVRVLSGRKSLDATVTNRLGEFEMEFEPARSLSLSLGIPGVRPFPVLLSLEGETKTEGRGTKGDTRRRRTAPKRRHVAHP